VKTYRVTLYNLLSDTRRICMLTSWPSQIAIQATLVSNGNEVVSNIQEHTFRL